MIFILAGGRLLKEAHGYARSARVSTGTRRANARPCQNPQRLDRQGTLLRLYAGTNSINRCGMIPVNALLLASLQKSVGGNRSIL
jgi:hypothetical protein